MIHTYLNNAVQAHIHVKEIHKHLWIHVFVILGRKKKIQI